MADETRWGNALDLGAKTRSLGPALREASADLLAFKRVLESVEKAAGLSTMTARLKRLNEVARETQKIFNAASGRQRLLEGGRTPQRASEGAAIELKAAAAEERAATKAERDAARMTISAARSLGDAASMQSDAARTLRVSTTDAQRLWRKVSGPVESSVGQAAADAFVGGGQRRGFGYAMYQIRVGLERKLVGGMAENLTKGLMSITVEPLFKSILGIGGPIGGIANLLFGNAQAASQAMFASSVATFAAAVGTFVAASGTQALSSATSAVSTAGSVGGIFGGIKSLFGLMFEGGGIVPSAAGGWSVPAALRGGVPSILHAREMVLPAHLSEGLQGMIENGGGGDVHLHFHGPADAPSVASWIAQVIGDNPEPMLRALRRTAFTLA